MELNEQETQTRDEALAYMKSHTSELLERFVTSKRPLPLAFTTIFMAGSPGSGKTEFSERYIPLFPDLHDSDIKEALRLIKADPASFDSLLIRIDVDEIRSFLPQYIKGDVVTGARANAHVVQKAANYGLDTIRNYCFEHDISFLHDGTFGNYRTMRELVKRSIDTERQVHIYYLYIDPVAAWSFTKAREFLEGRNILKDKFIEQYINSKDNVDQIKGEFGKLVEVHCILKNPENQIIDTAFNWPSVSQFLETKRNEGLVRDYNAEELMELLN